MRCVVSGASGHLGSYVVKRLVRQGWPVLGLVRPKSDLWRLEGITSQIQIVRAGFQELHEAASAITDFKPQAVFHLAWEGVDKTEREKPRQLEDNVKGSMELLDIARNAGCRFWLGIGSQAEYGPREDVLTEDTPTNPITPYAAAKLKVCLQTREACERAGMRYVWMRLLATYGPMDDERRLIPSTIKQLLQNQTPSLTEGEQKWDYLYVEDAAEAIFHVAASEASGIFNLGSGESYKVREVVETIRDLIDPSLSLGFGELPYRTDQSMSVGTSISKIQNATGWSPRVSLDEGLRRTVDWYRSNAWHTMHENT